MDDAQLFEVQAPELAGLPRWARAGAEARLLFASRESESKRTTRETKASGGNYDSHRHWSLEPTDGTLGTATLANEPPHLSPILQH